MNINIKVSIFSLIWPKKNRAIEQFKKLIGDPVRIPIVSLLFILQSLITSTSFFEQFLYYLCKFTFNYKISRKYHTSISFHKLLLCNTEYTWWYNYWIMFINMKWTVVDNCSWINNITFFLWLNFKIYLFKH